MQRVYGFGSVKTDVSSGMLEDRSTFLFDIFIQSNIVVLSRSIVDTFNAPDVSMGSFGGMIGVGLGCKEEL